MFVHPSSAKRSPQVTLAEQGLKTVVLESRSILGGRARSWVDGAAELSLVLLEAVAKEETSWRDVGDWARGLNLRP